MSEDKKPADAWQCQVETKVGEATYAVGPTKSLEDAKALMREFDTQDPKTPHVAVCTQSVKQKPPGPS